MLVNATTRDTYQYQAFPLGTFWPVAIFQENISIGAGSNVSDPLFVKLIVTLELSDDAPTLTVAFEFFTVIGLFLILDYS